MIEKQFVKDNINKVKLEEYLDTELERANYSHIDFKKTSTSTNITLYSEKPGLIIGRGGHRIKELIRKLKQDFGIENPQVEAVEVEKPDLDAEVVAKNVSGWLEKGGFAKRVGNTYARRVMEAGAAGVQIEIKGKLSGSRGRSAKFTRGYVKKCGNTAKEYVDYAYRKAVTKPGALGVKVRIMKEIPDYMHSHKDIEGEEEEEANKELEQKKKEIQEKKEKDKEAAEKAAEKEEEQEAKEEEMKEEKADEPEEADDEAEEAADIDYEDLSSETIKDIKAFVRDNDVDLDELLDAEKANKDRKTMKSWIESRKED